MSDWQTVMRTIEESDRRIDSGMGEHEMVHVQCIYTFKYIQTQYKHCETIAPVKLLKRFVTSPYSDNIHEYCADGEWNRPLEGQVGKPSPQRIDPGNSKALRNNKINVNLLYFAVSGLIFQNLANTFQTVNVTTHDIVFQGKYEKK